MPQRVEIVVRVESLHEVRRLLEDAYEALALLHSEAWDVLSASTREETREVQFRIEEVLALSPQGAVGS